MVIIASQNQITVILILENVSTGTSVPKNSDILCHLESIRNLDPGEKLKFGESMTLGFLDH